MSENQDRTARILAWAGRKADNAAALVDACDGALSANAPTPEDTIGTQRILRAVVALMAATKAVTAVVLAQEMIEDRRRAAPQEEDEMEYRDDDSPETLERLRDELERRLARLQSRMEAKGMGATAAAWATAGAPCEQVRPS